MNVLDVLNHIRTEDDIKLKEKIQTKTSYGVLSKGWYTINGEDYLVKGNSKGLMRSVIGLEPFSEVLASRLGKLLGIECVEYELQGASLFPEIKTYKCDYVSVCKQYDRKDGEQVLSFARAVDIFKHGYRDYYRAFKELEWDITSTLRMFLFDAVIGNMDRHLNNFEYGFDADGDIRLMPVMDFGASMLALVPNSNLKVYHGIGPDKSKPFKDVHEKQMQLLRRSFAQVLFEHMDTAEIYKQWIVLCEDIFEKMDPIRVESIQSYIKNRLSYLEPWMF